MAEELPRTEAEGCSGCIYGDFKSCLHRKKNDWDRARGFTSSGLEDPTVKCARILN